MRSLLALGVSFVIAAVLVFAALQVALLSSRGRTDPQLAGGEWKIEVQTPPCDSAHIHVVYPKESGYPITVECDSMPVPTR